MKFSPDKDDLWFTKINPLKIPTQLLANKSWFLCSFTKPARCHIRFFGTGTIHAPSYNMSKSSFTEVWTSYAKVLISNTTLKAEPLM